MKKGEKTAAAKRKGKKKGKKASPLRRFMRRFVVVTFVTWLLFSVVGWWHVSHSWQWISDKRDDWPRFVTCPLEYFGDRVKMITDGLGFLLE